MSVGRQFERIGQTGVALALWKLVFWIISSPKRFIISSVGFILIVGFFQLAFDYTNEKHYVNVNEITLLDKPFGNPIKVLHMNDSLILLQEMGDNWTMVLVGNDTLYFHDKNDFIGEKTIATTPFTLEKALEGEIVKLNHPDGYFDAKPRMLKNGDEIEVIAFSSIENEIKFQVETSPDLSLPIDYVTIEWDSLMKKYPHVDFSGVEKHPSF